MLLALEEARRASEGSPLKIFTTKDLARLFGRHAKVYALRMVRMGLATRVAHGAYMLTEKGLKELERVRGGR